MDSSLPGNRFRLWISSIFVLVIGIIGILIGAIPRIQLAVTHLLGSKSLPSDVSEVSWQYILLLLGVQLSVFLAVLLFLSFKRNSPRYFVLLLAFLFFLVSISAWSHRRTDIVRQLFDGGMEVYLPGESSAKKLQGAEAETAFNNRRQKDELRELLVLETIARTGLPGFLSNPEIVSARLQHPLLGYLMLLPFWQNAVLLRSVCYVVFLLSVLLVAGFVRQRAGIYGAALAVLSLLGASGLCLDLGFRVNLDVLTMAPATLVAFCLFPATHRGGVNDEPSNDSKPSRRMLLCAGLLLATAVMIKFTVLVLVIALSVVLFMRLRWSVLLLVLPSLVVFSAYQYFLFCKGVPFNETYLGEVLHSATGGGQRRFAGGGFRRSFTTLVVYILSPLGFLLWFGSLVLGWKEAIKRCFERRCAPIHLIALVGMVACIIVYAHHPLLRYLSPCLWALLMTISYAVSQRPNLAWISHPLIAASVSYSLTKLLQDTTG